MSSGFPCRLRAHISRAILRIRSQKAGSVIGPRGFGPLGIIVLHFYIPSFVTALSKPFFEGFSA